MMYLFPYKKIRPDSDVIVYGMGNVGLDYVEQLKVSGYAKLISIMDSNYKKNKWMKLLFDDICGITDIDKYIDRVDYVIIAILDIKAQNEVATELVQHGIEKEKIVFADNAEIGKNKRSIFRKKDLFDSKRLKYMMEDFFINADGNIEYFIFIILELKASFDKNKRISECLSLIEKNICAKWKIIIIRLYIQAGYLDAGLLKKFLNIVCQIEDLDEKYMLLSDIAILPVYFSESLYYEYYYDLKNAYWELINQYELEIPEFQRDRHKKIAVLLNDLGSEFGHSDFKKNIINGLSQAGFDVNVFCLDIRKWYTGVCFIKPFDGMACNGMPSSYYSEKHHDICEKAKFTYIDADNIKERMQIGIDKVFAYNPDIIIDITDEIAPQSYILNQYYHIIYWPMRGSASSMFHSAIILSSYKAADYYKRNFKNEEKVKVLLCNMKAQIGIPERIHCKAEFGWEDDDFIIITIGGRVEYELSVELMDRVCSMLKSNHQMKWLIVGSDKVEYLKMYYKELLSDNKIKFIKYENDLVGLYEICDVYLNPKRTGGAISRLWAYASGLPVIADASSYFDLEDLIDEEDLCWNIDEMISKIVKMSMDVKFKKEIKDRVKQSYDMWKKKTENNNIIETIEFEYAKLGGC